MTVLPAHVIEQARAVDLGAIARSRGLALKRQGAEFVGPCPICGGRDRFAINVVKALFNCRGCGAGGDAIALLQFLEGVGFAAAVESLVGGLSGGSKSAPPDKTGRAASVPPVSDADRRRHAADLWKHRQPITGTVAETYLREVRGYTGQLPATLGFLPAWRDVPPRMIAAFGLCDEPEPGILAPPQHVEAVHLTYLRPDGSGKANIESPKQFRGAPLGRPIVLAPPNDLLSVIVSEGIEDGLSAHQATGCGAWAAGSATFMPALADAVPDYVEAVTIYAHADPAGERGARQLAQAIDRRGIEVFIEGLAS